MRLPRRFAPRNDIANYYVIPDLIRDLAKRLFLYANTRFLLSQE